MRLLTPILLVALLTVSDRAVAQHQVEVKGVTTRVKLEEVIYGHLHELNGRFKLRVTEVTFEPGGHLGPHHHAGPGIRFVAAGQLTFTEGGHVTLYRAGDYFFESGNVAHTAQNATKSPVRVVFVEIVPADWIGPSTVPPRS
jgi:quercetin dioxygenase-like cupin family protein